MLSKDRFKVKHFAEMMFAAKCSMNLFYFIWVVEVFWLGADKAFFETVRSWRLYGQGPCISCLSVLRGCPKVFNG